MSPLATGCHGLWIRPSWGRPERVIETDRFRIVSDASAASLAIIARSADDMLEELDRLLPPPPGAPVEPIRELFLFTEPERFRAFLGAHLFAQERAIGFYCDLGGECALIWTEPPGPEELRVLRHELVHQHLARRLRGRLPGWFEEGLAERLALGPLAVPEGAAGQTARSARGAPGPGGRGAGSGGAAGFVRATGAETSAAGGADTETEPGSAAPPPGRGRAPACARGRTEWNGYKRHRAAVDPVHAAALLRGSGADRDPGAPPSSGAMPAPAGAQGAREAPLRRSWPGQETEPAWDVPPPAWAAGESGYVLHLFFIQFLEAIGEGRPGLLGRALDEARGGTAPPLDLSARYATLGEVEVGFQGYIERELCRAIADTGIDDPELAREILESLWGRHPGALEVGPLTHRAAARP